MTARLLEDALSCLLESMDEGWRPCIPACLFATGSYTQYGMVSWMESHMQRYLVNARMKWAKLVQVFGGLPPQRKSSSSECLPKSPVGIFTYPSEGRECFPLSRRRAP